jgi:hypothetical protein
LPRTGARTLSLRLTSRGGWLFLSRQSEIHRRARHSDNNSNDDQFAHMFETGPA